MKETQGLQAPQTRAVTAEKEGSSSIMEDSPGIGQSGVAGDGKQEMQNAGGGQHFPIIPHE